MSTRRVRARLHLSTVLAAPDVSPRLRSVLRRTSGKDAEIAVLVLGPGDDARSRLQRLGPDTLPVVALTEGPPGDQELAELVAEGAVGWVHLGMTDDALRATLADVADGGAAISRQQLGPVLRALGRRGTRAIGRPDGSPVRLTPREWQTLEAMAQGASTTDVARRLGVTATSVRGYVASAVRRLRVEDRDAAVALFRQQAG